MMMMMIVIVSHLISVTNYHNSSSEDLNINILVENRACYYDRVWTLRQQYQYLHQRTFRPHDCTMVHGIAGV